MKHKISDGYHTFQESRNWIKLGLKQAKEENKFINQIARNWIKLGLKLLLPSISQVRASPSQLD